VLLLQGDALYAMELALSLEKLNFQKLRELHDIASDANDAQMCDFIEGTLLAPQVHCRNAALHQSCQLII
jgi:ferritin heavy chain